MRFVYGTFLWPSKTAGRPLFGEIGSKPSEPDIALEILREFGASEFVGRLYTRHSLGSWTVAQLDRVRSTPWYKAYEKTGYEKTGKHFAFDMEGSEPWEVLFFRSESDESGPYVAVALRQLEKGKAPSWISAERKRF